MNKTKRTLIISSLVMALALIVTVVSVTAAWFSNVSDSRQDGFTIDSATLKESATISIDTNVGGSNSEIWPAVAKKGYLAQGGIAPSGKKLKNTPNAVDNTLDSIDVKAKTAVVYFPINFVGAPDTQTVDGQTTAIDGRKALEVSLNFVSTESNLKKETQDGKEVIVGTDKDVKSAFNVELDMVSVVKNADGGYTITPIDMTGIDPSKLSGTDDIYCNQPSLESGEPGYNLYLLVMPGETYYVRATIYFNQVDEEVDLELLYTTVFFNFGLKMEVDKDVDVRKLPTATA